jgi:HEAT repeat protein
MGKLLGLAVGAAACLVLLTAGVARPRSSAPTAPREYRATTDAEALEDITYFVAEERRATLQHLLEELREGTTLERARAAREMAKLGPGAAAAIPDLVHFLCDGRWAIVRDEIEDVLVAIGEEAVPAALDLIAQENSAGRGSGIAVLARIRGEAAVPVLAALLADKTVAKRAASRLASLGEPGRAALVAAVADASIPLKTLEEAVASAGKPMALPLAALLVFPDRGTRERAAKMLEKLGKNARPVADAIVRALKDPAFGDRLALVETLQFFDQIPPEAAQALLDVALSLVSTEASAEVRQRYVAQGNSSRLIARRIRELAPLRALARVGPAARGALPALLDIMDNGDPDALAAAARAHWRIGGDPRVAVDHLMENLAAFPDGGYHPALTVLEEMRNDAAAAIPALLRELESERGQRAWGAGGVLAAMGDGGVSAVRHWLPTGNPALVSVVAHHFDDTLRNELIARFGDEVEDRGEWLAAAESDDPLPELRRKLREPGDDKLDVTFLTLGSMGARAAPAVPDLIALLADDELRPSAASTLASIGPAAAPAVEALEPYLEDPSYQGRDAAIRALWILTGDTRYRDLGFSPYQVGSDDEWAVPHLVAGINRKGAWWRRECAAALGRLGAAALPAAADLARLAADENEDEYLRDAAREALVAIGG